MNSITPIKINDEQDLTSVAPKPAELYRDVPLVFLTAYSLYWLHEWRIRRTIEAIAVLNWRLFPEKFAMVGFGQFPDAFRTNRSLLQMQPKYRNLLTGAAIKGFSLNERGMERARELITALGVPETGSGHALGVAKKADVPPKTRGGARSIEPDREVARLRSSKLFDKWKQGVMTERDLIHVHALLGIFDHTPTLVRVQAMKDLQDAAGKVADNEAAQFLSDLQRTFPRLLMR